MLDRHVGYGFAPARAALAGNPSDAYGGAVLALTLPAFGARARVPAEGDCCAPELARATVARFASELAPAAAGDRVDVETNVPRAVGLGGSSAIVLAILRALCSRHRVRAAPLELARLALAVEVEELGIAAGPQDRVAQSLGGLVFMDFAQERHERLDGVRLPPLLVAWREDAAQHSGAVHAGLRERHARGDRVLRRELERLAACAHLARDALLAGRLEELRAGVDGSFDARARLLELDRRHVELVAAAREAGAAANFTGSGGAVVCVCQDEGERERAREALRRIGAETLAVGAVPQDGPEPGRGQFTTTTIPGTWPPGP